MNYNIEVWSNYAIVFGVRVDRPSRMSPTQWFRYWEHRKG